MGRFEIRYHVPNASCPPARAPRRVRTSSKLALMATASDPSDEELTSPEFLDGLTAMSMEEIRRRRSLCQASEEALSLRRRLVQGRLDIVQSDLCHRLGDAATGRPHEKSPLVDELPEILIEHGDRHLGPGRLTTLDPNGERLGDGFEEFVEVLDKIADGPLLSRLNELKEAEVRVIADQLDRMERELSTQRHRLHHHIDSFQAEMVRRYKSGEASVQKLLEGE